MQISIIFVVNSQAVHIVNLLLRQLEFSFNKAGFYFSLLVCCTVLESCSTVSSSADRYKWRCEQGTVTEMEAAEGNVHDVNVSTSGNGGTLARALPIGTLFNLLPKFDGQNMTLSDWVTRLQSAVRIYNVSPELQVEIALAALEGEARRNVLLQPEATRNTLQEMVRFLEEIYGETASAGHLRAKFFYRIQREDEGVSQYATALQEVLAEVQKKEADGVTGMGPIDRILREQFILGLYSNPLKQALRERVRVDPTLTFRQILAEAVTRNKEDGYASGVIRTQTVTPPGVTRNEEALVRVVQDLQSSLSAMHEKLTHLEKRIESRHTTEAAYPARQQTYQATPWVPTPECPYASLPYHQAPHYPSVGPSSQALRAPPTRRQKVGRQGAQCWRCGDLGHFARECRNNPAGRQEPPLNYRPLQ